MSNFNLQIPSLLFLPSNSIACKFHPLQCLNKTLLYCDNLPTNYTCPPFFGPVSVVLHFQVLHFYTLTFGPSFSGPAFSCLSSFLVPIFSPPPGSLSGHSGPLPLSFKPLKPSLGPPALWYLSKSTKLQTLIHIVKAPCRLPTGPYTALQDWSTHYSAIIDDRPRREGQRTAWANRLDAARRHLANDGEISRR